MVGVVKLVCTGVCRDVVESRRAWCRGASEDPTRVEFAVGVGLWLSSVDRPGR